MISRRKYLYNKKGIKLRFKLLSEILTLPTYKQIIKTYSVEVERSNSRPQTYNTNTTTTKTEPTTKCVKT